MLNVLDQRANIAAMTRRTHNNAGHFPALAPSPRGRHATDLPVTSAQAAAFARVLDDISARLASNSGRFTALSGRTGGRRVPCDAPAAFSKNSGTKHYSARCDTDRITSA